MLILLCLFDAAIVLEVLLAGTPLGWRARRVLAPAVLVLTAFASGGIVALHVQIFSVLFLVSSLYRIFNMVRITQNRMHEAYLRRATRRTSAVLMGLQLAIVVAWWAWVHWNLACSVVWTVLAAFQALVAALLLVTLVRRLRRTTWPRNPRHYSDSELPTLSVAIPARNETEDLEGCLRSLIASDYPKLEILVLDDCSQTKRTSEIIRNFAHDGVRFVQGEEPSETWLPKNQAYDRLAKEASGEFILFCGVDVRFAPDSLRQLIALLLAKNKEMASVLPVRTANGPALAQAMRYWWELVPPRRLFHRPPVLSTCWIISRRVLEKSGGFQAVARSITPEAFFARRALATDGYSFLRAGLASGIESAKGPKEQLATAARTRYPQLHRRPENVFVLAAAEIKLLLLPFVLAAAGWWLGTGLLAQLLALIACVLLTTTYLLLSSHTRTSGWLFGLIGLPAGVLFDIGLLHYSMWQYEFSTVDWKGRNICIPAMHVVPHLPKLE